MLPDIISLWLGSHWKWTLRNVHRDMCEQQTSLRTKCHFFPRVHCHSERIQLSPYFPSLKAAGQDTQLKPNVTKLGPPFLKEGLHWARETCTAPDKDKRCKLCRSVQPPGYYLPTLPISVNLPSWGLHWTEPPRSPLRKLSALLLIEKLKARGGHKPSPSTGPATLAVTPALF